MMMNSTFTLILTSISLSMTFPLITLLMSMNFSEKEIPSPFECGFSPFQTSPKPFSTQFFLIGVLFLLFDLEIVLLLPIPLLKFPHPLISLSITLSILILLIGLIYEWNLGNLMWQTPLK